MDFLTKILIGLGIKKRTHLMHKIIVRYIKKHQKAKPSVKIQNFNIKDIKSNDDLSKIMSWQQYSNYMTFYQKLRDFHVLNQFNKLLIKHKVLKVFYSSCFRSLSSFHKNETDEEFLKNNKTEVEYFMLRYIRIHGYGMSMLITLFPPQIYCPSSFSFSKIEKEWNKFLLKDEIINWN